MVEEAQSLAVTPNWAVATVISIMVAFGFFFHGSLKRFGKWLDKTKRKSLLAALEKIKEELMLFGLLSLLMGHWTIFVAKICIKSSVLSSRFYPCASERNGFDSISVSHTHIPFSSNYLNRSLLQEEVKVNLHDFCPEGSESFASYESLEQLHRFLFVLGITHVAYSFFAVAMAIIKIYSWRTWEDQAKLMAFQALQGSEEAASNIVKVKRLSTFIFHNTSHPWSRHKVFVWVLCFSRQFWSSINRADYMALRLGFITTHELHFSYDFHNYMLRSMEEEFRDIVGISVPLWIYGILCIFLDFHGSNVYFWLSFLPAILILLIGTKLHRIVVQLAVEIMDTSPLNHQFKLRDDLFWFGKPHFLLWLIQFISFQNAFEMATVIWSLWEVREASCFMENRSFLAIRLIFGVLSQFWCSFITFPLYVIVTQMGSKFKKSVISENVRRSLHGWHKRVKARQDRSLYNLMSAASTTSLDSMVDEMNNNIDGTASISTEERSSRFENVSLVHDQTYQLPISYENSSMPICLYDDDDDDDA